MKMVVKLNEFENYIVVDSVSLDVCKLYSITNSSKIYKDVILFLQIMILYFSILTFYCFKLCVLFFYRWN